MAENRVWKPISTNAGTVTGLIDAGLTSLDQRYEGFLPNLRASTGLLIGSDYSGESSDSLYLVYSFLVTTLDSWHEWDAKRLEVRQTYLTDSRRMSFKRLNDGQRKRALRPLLTAANCFNGLSFSVAVSKKCKSFFAGPVPLDIENPEFTQFRKWKPAVLQKAFVIVHIIGVLLAGLAERYQNVFWFTDEDTIAANDDRVRELTQLFTWICSSYLNFDLGHVRCGTSCSDNGNLQIEDFLAIPDLVAGAVSEQMSTSNLNPGSTGVFWMSRGDFSDKTSDITWWFSDARQPLKRLLCIIEPSPNDKHSLSWVHFFNRE